MPQIHSRRSFWDFCWVSELINFDLSRSFSLIHRHWRVMHAGLASRGSIKMAIKLNQSQPRSAKKFCRSTSERRADLAEQLISNIDKGRPYCDSFGNANPCSTSSYEQSNEEESQDYSLGAIMQQRDESGFAQPAGDWEQIQEQDSYAPALAYGTESGEFAVEAAPALVGETMPGHCAEAAPATANDGVMRTTEFLRQPNGTFIRPHYDRSGILTSIDFSDGCRFFRADAKSPWLVLDQWSKAVEGIDITSVSIDSRGNVVYIAGGEKSVIHIDGVIQ
jgi:hypothetical protein